MAIAVTGATGQLGRLIVTKVKDKVPADGIVALVRSPEKAVGLVLGVAARAFDYSKPGTLGAALDGVDTVMLVSSSAVGQRAQQHRNVINAAKAARIPFCATAGMPRTIQVRSPVRWPAALLSAALATDGSQQRHVPISRRLRSRC